MIRKISLIILSLMLVGVVAFVVVFSLLSNDKDNKNGDPITDSTQHTDDENGDSTTDGTQNTDDENGDPKDDDGASGPSDGDGQNIHICKFSFNKTVAPDCGNEGYDLYTCECGNEQRKNTKPATGKHNYKEEVHLPTCRSDWYSAEECTVCGDVKSDTIYTVEGTKVDHDYKWTETSQASCTEAGSKDGVCGWCGVTKTEVIPVIAHKFANYVSNNDATCTEDGTKKGNCTMCGTEGTVPDEGSKLGHICKNYVPNNDATCIKEGTLSGRCERCKAMVTIQGEKDLVSGHAYNNFTVTKGTCGQAGTISYKCIYCSKNITAATDVIPHSYDDSGECGLCERHMGWLYVTENAVDTDDFLQPYVYIDVSSVSGSSLTYSIEIAMETSNGFTPESVEGLYSYLITDVSTGFSGSSDLSGKMWNYEIGKYVSFNFRIKYSYSTKDDFVQFTVTGSGQYTDESSKVHTYQGDSELKIYIGGAKHTHSYGGWRTHTGSCIKESCFEKRCLLCSEKNVKNIGYEPHVYNGSICSVCNKEPLTGEGRYRVNLMNQDKTPASDFGIVYLEFKVNSITYIGSDDDLISHNYRISFEIYFVQYYIANNEVKELRTKAALKLSEPGWYGNYSFVLYNVDTNSNVAFGGIIDGTGTKNGDKFWLDFSHNSIYAGDYFYGDHDYEAECSVLLTYQETANN